jgi:chemotaxis protein methyltransferase CheR
MELMEKSQVYATDINADALITAEKGEYRYRFNKQYIENFNAVFCTGDRGEKECFSDHTMYMNVDATRDIIRMKKFLRRMPVWEKFDLVTDLEAFKGTFDIIICRNVIIYFNYELQNRVLKLLHEHLNHGGCLMLGMHESIIGPCSSLFRKEENIYYRKDKTM